MLPRDFSDSPLIVLSPHQHQFHPHHHPFYPHQHHLLYPVSRASHSFTHQTTKPIMPTKPWDRPGSPAGPSRSQSPTLSRKRGRESEIAYDYVKAEIPAPRTPNISPDSALGHDTRTPINPVTESLDQPGERYPSMLEEKLAEAFPLHPLEGTSFLPQTSTDPPKAKQARRIAAHRIRNFAESPNRESGSAPEADMHEIDQFTQMLGLGWLKISEDPDVVAATRGWVRYIENHYALSDVEVLAKNSGKDLVFVKSREGWYLLSEDLAKAVFVGRDWDEARENVTNKQARLEGGEGMTASETPLKGHRDGESIADPSVNQMDVD